MDIESYMKTYAFEKDKFYLILLDPSKVNFKELANLGDMDFKIPNNNAEINLIFVPCKDPKNASNVLGFETLKGIKDWLEKLTSNVQ